MRKTAVFFLCVLLLGAAAACSALSRTAAAETTPTLTTTDTPLPPATPTIQWFPPTRTPTPLITVTVLPTPEQRPGVGELLLQDSFTDNTEWLTLRDENGSVAVANEELTIAITTPAGQLASLRTSPVLDDYYMEITASASLCRQADSYGIIARASGEQVYYRFAVSCGGLARLERVKFGAYTIVTDWVSSGQIPQGSPSVLNLGVWARGEELRFFVNGVYQFSATGVNPLSGQVGVFARSGAESAVTVSFSNMKIFELNPE